MELKLRKQISCAEESPRVSYIPFLGFGKKGAGSKRVTWLSGGVDLA
jgi:hypothetical protein